MAPSFFERWFGSPENPDECLLHRQENLKGKFLFLSAEEDHNGALDPERMLKLLKEINTKYDLKYKVVSSLDEVCREVKKAAEIGKLVNVLINAHSDSSGMCLSNCKSRDGWLHKFKDYSKCFEGLDPLGKITLFGSKTGASSEGKTENNIAKKIATDSKKEVIAAIDMISSNGMEMADSSDFELYQMKDTKEYKVFKQFNPEFEQCTAPQKLHEREELAANVVKEAISQNSKLIYETDFEKQILRICKDSPKEKFLCLSFEADHNDALSPEHNKKLFEILTKNYDFKYRVVNSYKAICQEIEEASRLGVIVNLVIMGHGNNAGMRISENEKDLNNWIHKFEKYLGYKDLECFKKLPKSSKITLLSCRTGEPDEITNNPKDNIAQKMADVTQNNVVAPIEHVWIARTEITSINPFEVSHPSKHNANINVFKKFTPE